MNIHLSKLLIYRLAKNLSFDQNMDSWAIRFLTIPSMYIKYYDQIVLDENIFYDTKIFT